MNVPDAIMLLVSAALTAALASIILLDVSAFDAVTVRLDSIVAASGLGLLLLVS